ncbi:winged helix-turn-helix domain-containing protein [Hamadaea sp.]|uniref:winged helix-turn-helix domain-containing protein n=1 Tax=Hamadaea sp. TaxID=2024425 RepID=UPI0025C4C345|nr:winged helix-turn-helix domain-containing protein [Hamadaea sp.]
MITFGGLILDRTLREVTLDGRPLDLTPREFDLLGYLMRRPDTVVTRRELLTRVWQRPVGSDDRTIDVHVSRLRRKLGESPASPYYLHTVPGLGLRLSTPPEGGPPLSRQG